MRFYGIIVTKEVLDVSECYMGMVLWEKCSPNKNIIEGVCPYNSIHFIMSGSGYFNGQKLTSGMGFTVLNNQYVRYHPDRDDPWTYMFIIFHGEDREEFFKSQGLSYMVESPYTFTFSKKEDLCNMCNIYKGSLEALCTTNHSRSAALRLFLSFCREASASTELKPKSVYLKKATEFIDKNYTKDISVDGIASMLGISRSYLRNIFYESYGSSPQKYIINMRIGYAIELLKIPSNSVTYVSGECGYPDVLQFSKIFKKHTGYSPSVYRKMTFIPPPFIKEEK